MPRKGMQVSFRGRLGGPTYGQAAEQFVFSLWFGQVGSLTVAPTQAFLDAWANSAAATWGTFVANADAAFTRSVWADEVRIYDYEQGSTKAAQIGYGVLGTPVQGSSATYKPFQDSLVVTLRAEGRAKPTSGRCYLPPQGISVGQDGHIVTDIAGLLTTFRGFYETVRDEGRNIAGDGSGQSANGGLYGASLHGLIVSTTANRASRQVASVEMGNVVDTQRRRRNALVEARAAQDVVTA